MSKNSFKDYLIEIGQFPLLTAAEELELGKKIKEDGDKRAKEKLINCNLRLVVHIAKQYKGIGVGIEDLVAEGNLGLLTAAEKFDYTLGYRFSTCATPWIKQAILKAITDKGRTVRLPAHIYQQLSQIKKFNDKFMSNNDREPTKEETAKGVGITVEKLNDLLGWRRDSISLDTPLGDEDKNTLEDITSDPDDVTPEEYAYQQSMHDLISKMISELPERTQIITKMRYGLGEANDPDAWKHENTLEDIGAAIGITRERVRQIEKETIQNLKVKWKGRI